MWRREIATPIVPMPVERTNTINNLKTIRPLLLRSIEMKNSEMQKVSYPVSNIPFPCGTDVRVIEGLTVYTTS